MIPRPFDYERPESVEEAVALLARDGETKAIAGGQSLVPMLSLGLVRPDLVVDLDRLELAGIEQRADRRVSVGALTRHRALELSTEARTALPLVAEAAAHVGNPRVRNRGTFGGSLAHADPAAELPVVALVHGGAVVARGPAGERRIAIDEFFLGYLETALAHDELIVEVELDALPEGAGTAFYEEVQRADDFALACAAAAVTREGGVCAEARLALGGVGPAAVRLVDVEDLLRGEALSEALLERAGAAVEAAVEPEEDAFCSAAYRRRLAGVCARRALASAWGRAA